MSVFVTYNHTCDCCGVLIAQETKPVTDDVNIPTLPKVLNMDLCPDCHKLAAEAVAEVLEPRKMQFSNTRRYS